MRGFAPQQCTGSVVRRSSTQRCGVNDSASCGSAAGSVLSVSTDVVTSHTALPLRSLSRTSPRTRWVTVIRRSGTVSAFSRSKTLPRPV